MNDTEKRKIEREKEWISFHNQLNHYLKEKNSIDENDYNSMIGFYDSIDHSELYNTFPSSNTINPSELEKNLHREWFFSILEGKSEQPIDESEYFDCWFNKIQILVNIKMLKEYKEILYDALKVERLLDTEVSKLIVKQQSNILLIDSLKNKLLEKK
jgi:hypothetical protein